MADPAGTQGAINEIITFAEPRVTVSGSTTTAGASAVPLISAPATTGLLLFITGLQFGNLSSSTVNVTLNDTASSVFIVPAGGGSNSSLLVPLQVQANTTLTFTPSGAVNTISANAQGYIGGL
jgi:hypothetical protein